MSSAIFRKLPSNGITTRYSVEFSDAGKGLGKKPQLSASEMMEIKSNNSPRWFYPRGVDRRAPILKKDGFNSGSR